MKLTVVLQVDAWWVNEKLVDGWSSNGWSSRDLLSPDGQQRSQSLPIGESPLEREAFSSRGGSPNSGALCSKNCSGRYFRGSLELPHGWAPLTTAARG